MEKDIHSKWCINEIDCAKDQNAIMLLREGMSRMIIIGLV